MVHLDSFEDSIEGSILCWSRMQAEAGQHLEKIVARKEMERKIGQGLFFWGVGNPPSTAVASLARHSTPICVVFSVMKSRPKADDVSPKQIRLWRRYIDHFGRIRDIPNHVLITSRTNSRNHHYALQCSSDSPLELSDYGPFDPNAYRNVSGTGGRIGSSQVTALVRQVEESGQAHYRVNLKARLTDGYWVKLIDPVEITSEHRKMIDSFDSDTDCSKWLHLVQIVRAAADTKSLQAISGLDEMQSSLF